MIDLLDKGTFQGYLKAFGDEVLDGFDPVKKAAWLRTLLDIGQSRVAEHGEPACKTEIAWGIVNVAETLIFRLRQSRYRNEADQLRKAVVQRLSFSLDDQLVDGIDFARALQALQRKDPEARNMLLLFVVFGLTLKEIARERNATVQKVRTRIKRGMTFFSEYFAVVKAEEVVR